jgi:hypothetical protein
MMLPDHVPPTLTTGQAAKVLGVKQHQVVYVCDRYDLGNQWSKYEHRRLTPIEIDTIAARLRVTPDYSKLSG